MLDQVQKVGSVKIWDTKVHRHKVHKFISSTKVHNVELVESTHTYGQIGRVGGSPESVIVLKEILLYRL